MQNLVEPTVSVIMTAYNEERFISEAIKSVLAQTFSDWELIVVDDGSTDRTAEIAATFAEKDLRVRLLQRPHEGRAPALNAGLQASRGRYIAILDADDIAMPERLETQVAYLENHPDVGVVGGFCLFKDHDSGEERIVKVPLMDKDIRKTMLWRMAFNHTTIMMRRESIGNNRYRDGKVFEDYLFCASLLANCKGANLPEVLVVVNRHEGSVTQPKWRMQNYYKALRTQYLVLRVLKAKPHQYLYLIRPIGGLIMYSVRNLCRRVKKIISDRR